MCTKQHISPRFITADQQGHIILPKAQREGLPENGTNSAHRWGQASSAMYSTMKSGRAELGPKIPEFFVVAHLTSRYAVERMHRSTSRGVPTIAVRRRLERIQSTSGCDDSTMSSLLRVCIHYIMCPLKFFTKSFHRLSTRPPFQ